jgi:hypothetical protein
VHGAHITISTTYNFDYNLLNFFQKNSFSGNAFSAVAEAYHAVNPSYTVEGLANSLLALQDNNGGVDVIVHVSPAATTVVIEFQPGAVTTVDTVSVVDVITQQPIVVSAGGFGQQASTFARYEYRTFRPTASPSVPPTALSTIAPTNTFRGPTSTPTTLPTIATPSTAPSSTPSASPSAGPTAVSVVQPTALPTLAPTRTPTAAPTLSPTVLSTGSPAVNQVTTATTMTIAPTTSPTAIPSQAPTLSPTVPGTGVGIRLIFDGDLTTMSNENKVQFTSTAIGDLTSRFSNTSVADVSSTTLAAGSILLDITFVPGSVGVKEAHTVVSNANNGNPIQATAANETFASSLAVVEQYTDVLITLPTAMPSIAPTAEPTEAPTAMVFITTSGSASDVKNSTRILAIVLSFLVRAPRHASRAHKF